VVFEFLYSLTDTPIEVKGYTRNEFLKMIEKRNPMALDALVEGKVIVDDGFWELYFENKFRILYTIDYKEQTVTIEA
jgi:hypothetical protein